MSFRAYSLTMTGAAQQLSDVYGQGASVVGQQADAFLRQIVFQADRASGNAIYVGSDDLVSVTNHGFSVESAVAAGTQPAYELGPFENSVVRLSDFWVLGTAGQRLMISVVPLV